MIKFTLFSCTLVFLASCASSSFPPAPIPSPPPAPSAPRPSALREERSSGWFYLGDKSVNFGVDYDELFLGNIKDDFRQIQLRVTDGPVHIKDMKIHFDNGGVQDVSLRSKFRQGDQSRIIDLDGGTRHLNKITFWYETIGFRKGKSRVAVWGYR